MTGALSRGKPAIMAIRKKNSYESVGSNWFKFIHLPASPAETETWLSNKPGSSTCLGYRPQLAMNGRLGDLLLRAEQTAGKDQKAVNALKRGLRQNGVKLEG